MSEEIVVKQTMPMRARPEVLYRLALEPRRRAAWDSNLVSAAYTGEGQRLAQNALADFQFVRRLLGLKFQVKYGQLISSQRGGWEAVKPFGPLEKFSQQWNFKPMPGGTEVTLTVKGTVRYKWIRTQMERILQNLTISTLMDLQRQVDAPTAQLVEEMGREMAEKQKAEQKAAKAARKGKKG